MILFRDRRRAGPERLRVLDAEEPVMLIPEMLQQTAVLLYRDTDTGPSPVGTGFLLRTVHDWNVDLNPDQLPKTYIVTAAHNLKAFPNDLDDVVIVYPQQSGTFGKMRVARINWVHHPEEPDEVDAAVAELPEGTTGINFDNVVSLHDCADEKTITDEAIGLGDPLYITGLFSRLIGVQAYTAIVRTGNIAMMPKEKVQTVEQDGVLRSYYVHLAEVRSIAGLSGSPVFVYPVGVRKAAHWDYPMNMNLAAKPYLLGLIHGHWNLPETEAQVDQMSKKNVDELLKVNTGIAMVVPTAKILEIINCERLVNRRRESKVRELRKMASTADSLSGSPDIGRKAKPQKTGIEGSVRAAKSMYDQIIHKTEGGTTNPPD